MKRLSIVLPAWNEEEHIGRTLIIYLNYFCGRRDYDFEIIAVVDGCTDRTPAIVKEFSKKFKQIKFLNFPKRLGKGGGIIEGFKVATGDFIAFTDADASIKPEELDKLISKIGNCDGAIGSRWLPGSIVTVKQSLARRIASRGFNFMVRLLLGLPFKDTQCSAKVFKNYVIKDVINDLDLTNFAFDVDLLYRVIKRGYRVKEIPLCWEHSKESKLNLSKIIPEMFISIIGLRIKVSYFYRFLQKIVVKLSYNRLKA